MRRRQTAAPLDAVDTAQADATDTNRAQSTDTAPLSDTAQSESPETIAPTGAESAPAKPRRARRPKAVENADTATAEPQDAAPSLLEAIPAPRPRRARKPAATDAAMPEAQEAGSVVQDIPAPESVAPSGDLAPIAFDETAKDAFDPAPFNTALGDPDAAPDAEDALIEVFGDAAEAAPAPLDADPSLPDLLAESEAILDEVLGEAAPGDAASRSRRNRRGRGRGRSGDTPDAAPTPVPVFESFRKRGPRVLARTMPLPALPVTGDVQTSPAYVAPTRKRGVRVPVALRRIITLDGVSVVSVAQAAALLGSAVLVPASGTVGGTGFVPLVPRAEPLAPLYTPLPSETLSRFPLVSVAKTNNVPELLLNGTPVLPAFLFVNTEVADEPEVARDLAASQIRRAYASGLRLFTLLAHLPWKRKSGERRYDSLDAAFALVADNAPDAQVLPRLIFSPPVSWERANPDEMADCATGEPGDVSIGSDAFWHGEATDALRAATEHLATSDHAARTVGVYLEHAEWFHPKGVGADRSPANTAAFRAYLKARYKDSEVALRSAWYDGSVTFDAAEIPSAAAFAGLAVNGTQPVFLGERDARIADFYHYTSRVTAERITHLAAVAKAASGGRLAVATSYGYSLEIARPGCGHFALADVLASPDVDILTAPFSYTGRLPGGSAPFSVPVDSVHLAGKLLVCEDDTKTHLALRETGDAYNPKIATVADTRAVHARNIGMAVAKGCGISWMDLWGEGWLNDDATWEHLGSLLQVMDAAAQLRRVARVPVAAPSVAVFVDETSVFETGGGEEPAILSELIGRHRDVFARAGASVGYYLLSDLLKPDFPQTPGLFVFLNAARLPLAIRTVLQNRWQSNGRTFAWLFAPGVGEPGNIAELSETIGIQLRLQPWGSRTGTVVTDGRFTLTENAKGERFGEEKRINPSLTVVDPKSQILGEYVSSGNPSLAYRKHPRWQSVFIGEREMPLPLVRGLYRLAGVPIATPGDDATAVAGDGFVSVHSVRDSDVTVFSPTRAEGVVYDAVASEVVAKSGYGATVSTVARATRLLFFAEAEDVTALFSVAPETLSDAPEALPQSALPVVSKTFVFETPVTAPNPQAVPVAPPPGPQATRLYPVELSVSAEDIAQFEAALAGEIALLDKEDDGAETEANRKKRRRRRRRGDRTDEVVTDGTESGDDGDTPETDPDTADAVFDLADMTQSATTYDADALLPLLDLAEDVPASNVTVAPQSSRDIPVDPVADMMSRLFTMPELGGTPAAPESPRRPTLDELLPFSGEVKASDAEQGDFNLFATDFVDPILTATEESAAIAESEIVANAAETEAPLGLLAGATARTRQTRTAGGFASRLRRRATEREPGDAGASEPNTAESAPLVETDPSAEK